MYCILFSILEILEILMCEFFNRNYIFPFHQMVDVIIYLRVQMIDDESVISFFIHLTSD